MTVSNFTFLFLILKRVFMTTFRRFFPIQRIFKKIYKHTNTYKSRNGIALHEKRRRLFENKKYLKNKFEKKSKMFFEPVKF